MKGYATPRRKVGIFLTLILALGTGTASAQEPQPVAPKPAADSLPEAKEKKKKKAATMKEAPPWGSGPAKQSWDNGRASGGRVITVSGRVRLPDGSPAEVIPVVLQCNAVSAGANTRLEGEFSVYVQVPNSVATNILLSPSALGCVVNVRVPGFQPARYPAVGLEGTPTSAPWVSTRLDVGTIMLRPLEGAAASVISMNSLRAPAAARQEFLIARQEAAKGELESARDHLTKAIAAYPTYAVAWFETGRIQERQGLMSEAAESYLRADSADSQWLNPRVQLALMASTVRQWPAAEQHAAAIIKVAPDGMPGVYLVHAIACFNQQKLDDAARSAREGLRQDRGNQFPKLVDVLGATLVKQGDAAGAIEVYRESLERTPEGAEAERYRQRIAALGAKQ